MSHKPTQFVNLRHIKSQDEAEAAGFDTFFMGLHEHRDMMAIQISTSYILAFKHGWAKAEDYANSIRRTNK